jgi:hypothetical protein
MSNRYYLLLPVAGMLLPAKDNFIKKLHCYTILFGYVV